MDDLGQAPQVSEMTADEVDELLTLVDEIGVTIWLDGGWGVDALLGHQTRLHGDLDIVIQSSEVETLRGALVGRGFSIVDDYDNREWNFLLGDDDGRQVDFHVIELDVDGNGVYGPPGDGVSYPAWALNGIGSLESRRVRCLTAEYQVESHTGYLLRDVDHLDVAALCRRFGIDLPPEYQGDG